MLLHFLNSLSFSLSNSQASFHFLFLVTAAAAAAVELYTLSSLCHYCCCCCCTAASVLHLTAPLSAMVFANHRRCLLLPKLAEPLLKSANQKRRICTCEKKERPPPIGFISNSLSTLLYSVLCVLLYDSRREILSLFIHWFWSRCTRDLDGKKEKSEEGERLKN